MPSQTLISSVLKCVAHDNGNLTIQFKKTGNRYRYDNVPMKEYVSICIAKEPGKYYKENIKGKYKSHLLQKYQA